MIQLCGGLCFLLESTDQLRVPVQSRRENLDCHLAFQHQVPGQKDDGHTAPAQQPDDLVATLEGTGQPLLKTLHFKPVFSLGDIALGAVATGGKRGMALGTVAQRNPLGTRKTGKSRQPWRTPRVERGPKPRRFAECRVPRRV